MDHLISNLVLGAIVLSPMLIPALTKKWVAFWITFAGYALYILWGVNLYFTEDIQDYGTGYGLFIIPYIIILTIISSQFQKRADRKKVI
ncbi:hypothetical protein V7654_06675 [Bacillus sp. JJ1609]|uniref:hypothetical protein n=1 Tax=Bacillus sp. JJ1609 TaxID=3122977 RepID=UPI002FFF6669